MTSTNMFNGFETERKSSRVLRPPGGGHTDVLGVRSGPEEPRPRRAVRPTLEEPPAKNAAKTVTEAPTEDAKPPVVCKDKPKVETAATNSVAAPTRTRVPPGGFSSGAFW